MTTLAQDIEALMALGHDLENATKLAREDRARAVSLPPGTQITIIIYLIYLMLLLNAS